VCLNASVSAKARFTRQSPHSHQPLLFFRLERLHLNNNFTHISRYKMSSPGHRRQRSSKSASSTPKRASQRSAIPSSPPDPAAAQLQNEAASSQGNGTPRRGVPSSSPMNYRSSPADLARATRDVSSPLRQMTNTQTTDDGDRTPRASGMLGG